MTHDFIPHGITSHFTDVELSPKNLVNWYKLRQFSSGFPMWIMLITLVFINLYLFCFVLWLLLFQWIFWHHALFPDHSSSIRNCDTYFLSRGRGGQETRKGGWRDEKENEENGVVLNLNSPYFWRSWKCLKDFMIKFVTFYLPVQPAEIFPSFPAIWRHNIVA